MKSSRIILALVFAAFALALPALAQDSTPEATAVDLQTYATDAASIQFPAGWVSQKGSDTDSILAVEVANTESALSKELFNQNDVFQPGEAHISVAVISLATLINTLPAGTVTANSSPLDILQALIKEGMPDTVTFGTPGNITLNGNPAVRMNVTAPKRGEGQIIFTIIDKQWLAGILLFAAPGEADKWDITTRNILASVTIKPEVEPTSIPQPTKTYTSAAGMFTIAYPVTLDFEDHSSSEAGGYIGGVFYSNPDLRTKTPVDDFHAGDVSIEFKLMTLNDFITKLKSTSTLKLDSSTSPLDILREVMKDPTASKLRYGIAQELPLPYGSLAQVDVSGTGNNEGHIYLIKRSIDGGFILLTILAAPNELETGEATALMVAASLTRFTTDQPVIESTAEAFALTQTAKTQNGMGTLSYPDNWFSRQYGTQSIYVSNSQDALNKSFGSTFQSGQVNLLSSLSSTDDYIKQAKLPVTADATPLQLLQASVKSAAGAIQFGTPQATTVGDKLAARVDFKGDGFDGIAWIIQYQPGATIVAQMLTAPGESPQWESVVLTIAASVHSTD